MSVRFRLERVQHERGMRMAAPARISAATQIASISSYGVAPALLAALVWPLMQYGHWVTCTTATR